MIISCEPTRGEWACAARVRPESEASVRRSSERMARDRELEDAAVTAEKYGMYDAARQFRAQKNQ